jgi:hypothetical protein
MLGVVLDASLFSVVVGLDLFGRQESLSDRARCFVGVGVGKAHADLEPGSREDSSEGVHRR